MLLRASLAMKPIYKWIAACVALLIIFYLIWRYILPQNLIAKLEGFSAKPYADGAGYSTGFGHQILPGEEYLMGAVLSLDDAKNLLLKDISTRYAPAVDSLIRGLGYTAPQRAALISFHYNTGRISALKPFILARDFAGLRGKMNEYVRYKGAVNSGLVKRRALETSYFPVA